MSAKLNKIASIATVGGIGILTIFALAGCEQKPEQKTDAASANAMNQAAQKDGVFMVIQEVAPGAYKVVEQYPTQGASRAVLKDINGTEKLLNDEELKALATKEAAKVENNTSRLTQENSSIGSTGMSLGETILASAAGALIGGYIANKLFNNPNFAANQRVTPQTTMSQPAVKSPTTQTSGPAPQKGYFQNTASPSSAPATTNSQTSTTQSSGAKPQSGYFSSGSSSSGSSGSSTSSSSGSSSSYGG